MTKQNNGIAKWIILLGVVLVGFWVFLWFKNHQAVYRTEHLPLPEVKQSPFYTANFLLNTQNKNSELLGKADNGQLRQIWADTDTAKGKMMVIQHLEKGQDRDLNAMLSWVQAGGHLVGFSRDVLRAYANCEGYEFCEIDSEKLNANPEFVSNYLDDENPLVLALGLATLASEFDSDKYNDEFYKLADTFGEGLPLRLPNNETIVVASERYGEKYLNHNFLNKLKATPNLDTAIIKDLDRYEQYAPFAEQLKPIHYQLLTDDKNENLKRLNGLTDKQKEQVLKYHQFDKANFSANRMLYDATLGAGRITIFTNDEWLSNPYPTGNGATTEQASSDTQTPDTQEKSAKPKDSPLWQKLTYSAYDDNSQLVYDGRLMTLDNAYFLNFLAKDANKVWFVANFESPPLSALLWRHLPFLLVAVGVSLLLLMLALPRQFGARVAYREDTAFNLFLLFEEIAGFLWRADQLQKQVDDSRKALLETIYTHLPTLNKATPSVLCATVAEHSRLDDETVYNALYGEWANEKEFIIIGQAFTKLARAYGR